MCRARTALRGLQVSATEANGESRKRPTRPPHQKQQPPHIIAQRPYAPYHCAPPALRVRGRGRKGGVYEEGLRGGADGVEEEEGGVADVEEGARGCAVEGEEVEGVSRDFGEGPGEDHGCVKGVRADLRLYFLSEK